VNDAREDTRQKLQKLGIGDIWISVRGGVDRLNLSQVKVLETEGLLNTIVKYR